MPLPPPIPDRHTLLSISGTGLNSDALRFPDLPAMKYQRYSSGLRQYAESLRFTDYNDLTPISQNWLSEIRELQIKKYSTTFCGVGVSPAPSLGRTRCPPHKIG